MNTNLTKLKKALAIALAVLQIPMLVLWKITFDAVKLACHEIKILTGGGYMLEFQPEQLGKAILTYLPMMMALLVCLALSILSLMKRKGSMGIVGICFAVAITIACGVLIYAFYRAPAVSWQMDGLRLSEYMFFRYFMDSKLNLKHILPFWKYILLGLQMVVSVTLSGLGIAELVSQKRSKNLETNE